MYVRRVAGEALKENCVQTAVKHGGGGSWCAVSSVEKVWESLRRLTAD